ncbi:MAG: peptidase S41, partial [Acidobacteriota bacterium]
MRKPSFSASLRPLFRNLVLGSLLVLACFGRSLAVDTKDTKFLTQPAVSADLIVFVYANDLWTANLDGKNVRRLTSDVGVEALPVFSPDGSLVAFSGQYEGNTDVYVVPALGGIPKRLTWHPGADLAAGFTPDGKSVVFISARESAVRSYAGLYTVPVEGGMPVKLPIPYASRAAFSADGKYIAYNPFGDAFLQWKHYRGGTHSRVWIFNNADQSIEKVPQPADRSNDAGPMWVGSKVYFRSDRNGEFNLFSYDRATKEVKQLTFYKDYPVLNASAGAGRIVFEQAGVLHLYDVDKNSERRLTIGVSTDLPELRARYAKGFDWVRSLDVSPTGARALIGFRGEVVTVPAEKGDPRNLTNTPGVYERAPAWSPDGKSIAYFSDASGEYALHVRPQDGKGEVKKFKLNGSGYYGSPTFSPDSQKIAYADNSLTLYWLDLKTGAHKKIGAEYIYQPGDQADMDMSWSPDSKWLAYTVSTQTFFRRVFVYSLDQDKSFPITDGLSDVAEPAFDPSGKYLYFFASTDAGPARQWFDQSNADLRETSSLYMAVLRKDLPNPLAKESDEEKAPADAEKKEEKPKAAAPAAGKPGAAKPAPAPAADAFRIDFDGLEHRIVAVSIPAGIYGGLKVGETGKIYYLATDLPANLEALANMDNPSSELHLYDLAER